MPPYTTSASPPRASATRRRARAGTRRALRAGDMAGSMAKAERGSKRDLCERPKRPRLALAGPNSAVHAVVAVQAPEQLGLDRLVVERDDLGERANPGRDRGIE